MTVLVRNQDILDTLHDRGLRPEKFGWPLEIVEAAIQAAQRGWLLASYRPGKVVVRNNLGDRIVIHGPNPVPALRSLPNELVRE